MADAKLLSAENGVSTFESQGEIGEAFGKTFTPPKRYTFQWKTYGTKEAAVAANKWPSDADEFVLNKINKQNENSAKSAAYQAELKSEKEAYEASPEFKFKQAVDSALSLNPKLTREAAEAFVKSIMGASL